MKHLALAQTTRVNFLFRVDPSPGRPNFFFLLAHSFGAYRVSFSIFFSFFVLRCILRKWSAYSYWENNIQHRNIWYLYVKSDNSAYYILRIARTLIILSMLSHHRLARFYIVLFGAFCLFLIALVNEWNRCEYCGNLGCRFKCAAETLNYASQCHSVTVLEIHTTKQRKKPIYTWKLRVRGQMYIIRAIWEREWCQRTVAQFN